MICCSSAEREKITSVIQMFLSTNIIEEVHHCVGEFISAIFPVSKPNGDIRIILNLKPLNVHVTYEHFKMEHLNTALGLMQEHCFMSSIDLKDAYYSVNVHESHRKYLRFFWNNKLYQLTCLAQGLSCAPRLFTKVMKPIFARLRSEVFLSVFYLDDSLLIGKDRMECTQNVEHTAALLTNAGFIINVDKSSFSPSKEITFLGFCLNSETMTISLPLVKRQRIFNMCTTLSNGSLFPIREVARFIGLLVSSFPAVRYGPLFYRFLEKNKILALKNAKGNFDSTMQLDADALDEVKWWADNVLNSFCPIKVDPPALIISTDASLSGWGCSFNGLSTGGRWSPLEAVNHINVLEIKAVLFSLQSLLHDITGTHVRVQSDGTTTVSYINNFGGVKSISCHRVAGEIWFWAFERQNHLSAEHLPGAQNVLADRASRIFDENTEWQLSDSCFRAIFNRFGPFDIDLFASRLNALCDIYCAWKPDPRARFIDAFSVNWNKFHKAYVFPPFSVIMKCLQKLCQDQAQAVFVTPLWPTQPWFPKLIQMLVAVPLLLPLNVLNLPFNTTAVHRQHKNLRLMACHLSGISTRSETFQKKQLPSSAVLGEPLPSFNTKFILQSGYISVINKNLIPYVTMP